MHINSKGGGARTARLKIAKKPVYFALDQRLVRRHKTLLFLSGLGQVAAVLVVIVSGLAPNVGNRAYASSGAYAGPHGSSAFVMLVKTDNSGSSNSSQFTIPTNGSGYNYSVDCNDDGSFDAAGQTGNYTCTYGSPGTYSVAIQGSFPRIFFNNSGDRQKLLEIQQWGNIAWSSMQLAFFGTSNMQITATDTPNLSNVTSMQHMFNSATTMNANLNNWNVSNVTDMYGVFYGASSFNGNITNWDVSSVTNMNSMFRYATNFNQPIGSWSTANKCNNGSCRSM